MYLTSIKVSLTEAATMNISNIIEQYYGVKYSMRYNVRVDLLYNAVRVFYVIIPMIFLTAVAQFIGQLLVDRIGVPRFVRYVIEFVVIVIPTLFLTLKFHKQAGYVTIICSAILLALLLITFIRKPRQQLYIIGGIQPYAYALNRAIVYVIAILGLAAPRFLDIPRYFKETHRYGAGFLDVGVGLYVFAIATGRSNAALRSPMHAAASFFKPMMFLSFVRMLIMLLMKYNYSHPIRLYENYYFIILVVVSIGSVICEYVRSTKMRILTGLVVLLCHESILELDGGEVLFSTTVKRFDITVAIKEVYLTIPGFLALYLISVGIGNKMRTTIQRLPAKVFMKKILTLLKTCVSFWTLTLFCVFTTSISRISCNIGYVAWILAVGCTMTLMHILVFNFIFTTLKRNANHGSIEEVNVIPEFVAIINKNGVLCYILGYMLAISMNSFFAPLNRNEFEAFGILTIFMFFMSQLSYLLKHVSLYNL